jgi:hypothetical protein
VTWERVREDLLDHINKVKAIADQLACLEVPVRDLDVVMTLLESLPPSYEYLITALETLPMQPGHIERFCFKAKNNNKEKENANTAKDDDDYAFATKDGDHCKAICKWIMDSGATKHMTPHRATFDMYEVIPTRNVHMGDDSIVEAIGMGSILVEVMVKG